MWPLIAASVAAPIVGGLIGDMTGKSDRSNAETYNRLGMEAYQSIDPNSLSYEQAPDIISQYNPNTPDSQEGKLVYDPETLANYRKYLDSIKGISETGMDSVGRLSLSEANQAANLQNRAAQGAITQDMAARGVMGGGAELSARLAAQQNASNQMANSANQVAANMQNVRMAALNQFGRGTFNQGQSINRFNRANTAANDVNERFRNQNQFNRFNAMQNLAVNNAQIKNNQARDRMQFQLNRAGGMAGQYQNMATNAMNNSQRKGDMWNSIGGGISNGAAAYGSFLNNERGNKLFAASEGLNYNNVVNG